jgi:hypothetical protein
MTTLDHQGGENGRIEERALELDNRATIDGHADADGSRIGALIVVDACPIGRGIGGLRLFGGIVMRAARAGHDKGQPTGNLLGSAHTVPVYPNPHA